MTRTYLQKIRFSINFVLLFFSGDSRLIIYLNWQIINDISRYYLFDFHWGDIIIKI